ncbi:MAG TPA: hypothetical protein VJ974_01400 [Geopsychrobacteraceae bacterium]|nr:hypothetical protein [Geopsychrobacteraceae bacterium]
MRKSALLVIVALFLFVSPALSASIGPIQSRVSAGDAIFGLGYSFTDSRWEEKGSFSNLEIQQNRFFGQAGYGLSDRWVTYLRAGISTYDADNATQLDFNFQGENVVPFVTVGINGLFFEGEVLSIGPFIQGSYYFGENEDSQKFLIGAQSVKETVTLDNMWEARAGLEFQMELEGAQLYGGPMYYISRTDINSNVVGLSTGTATLGKTVEEENNFGMVFGVQWNLMEDVTLDLEAQLRSAYDIGLVLNKRF